MIPNRLFIYGPISRDASYNYYRNYNYYIWPNFSGHLKVTQNSANVVLERDIRDDFWEYAPFAGTANITIEVWGQTPLELSRASIPVSILWQTRTTTTARRNLPAPM